jgi:membrane protease YdiL (CAAX protease family)
VPDEQAGSREEGDGAPSPSPKRDARTLARHAIAVTCAMYVGYGVLRLVLPGGFAEYLGLALIAGFYFVPQLMLRKDPELADRWQVGPDVPVPRWSWHGAKVAGIAAAVVFPPFLLIFFWFYWQVCSGDLTILWPAIWVESFTSLDGKLAGFLGRLCSKHEGGFFPEGIRLPARWVRWWGLGFLYEVGVGIFAIALPEEVFHRGYLMSALEERWPPTRKLFGVPFGLAAVLSSVLFAVGHLVGMAETARLATFFPALVFAWLWRRSGSLWAPALFHTASNLLMDLLLASTFPVVR